MPVICEGQGDKEQPVACMGRVEREKADSEFNLQRLGIKWLVQCIVK